MIIRTREIVSYGVPAGHKNSIYDFFKNAYVFLSKAFFYLKLHAIIMHMKQLVVKKQRPTHRMLYILLAIVVLIVVGFFTAQPILRGIEQQKFKTLDEHSRRIYNQLVSVTDPSDTWKYAASCAPEYTGDWPTGQYDCQTLISLEKTVHSVNEVNALRLAFYPVINGSPYLKAQSKAGPDYSSDFGKKFVVSSAERVYKDRLTSETCRYLLEVEQPDSDSINFALGTEIEGNQGKVSISLACINLASQSWYQQVNTLPSTQ
jgi:hypothetical protein